MSPRAFWIGMTCLSAFSGVVLAGCCSNCGPGKLGSHGTCGEDLTGQLPQPNGIYTRELMYRQSAKAEADDFVIYLHEWQEEVVGLGPFGNRHVASLVKRLPEVPFNILIEASDDPKLDDARHLFIVNLLGKVGIVDPAKRVIVGYPAAEGLYGDEAGRAYTRLLIGNYGQNGGGGLGGGGFGGGGFGGGGFSGGAGFSGGSGFGAPGFQNSSFLGIPSR